MIEPLEPRQLLSTSWFVAPWGSNNNPGTAGLPLQTVQAAADVAQPGDHVEIRAGVYDETVSPAHSGTPGNPIVYEAYNNEPVTISGADPVTGWTRYSGNIYRAAAPADLGAGNNQLFVDGSALVEARWPSTGLDPLHPTLATADSVVVHGNVATLYDKTLTQPAGFWTGATISIAPGQAWVYQTGTVVQSAPGQITYAFTPTDGKYELPTAGNGYFLSGSLKFLDAPGEFFVDPSTRDVYVYLPGGGNPADHNVTLKSRDLAFNLSGASNITLSNLTIFASTIVASQSSASVVVDHLSALYTSQFLAPANGWIVPIDSGITLRGPDSVFENSTVAFSAGDGVTIGGNGSRVVNNIIRDIDSAGVDAAGVRVVASNVQVDDNTIYDTGRDGIRHTGQLNQILNNTLHDIGMLTTEAGAIYCEQTNGDGTEIADNLVYAMHSMGFGETALYLDNYSSGYVVHDNRTYDVDTALKLNFTSRYNTIYNNTLIANGYSIWNNDQGDWDGTKLNNNLVNAAVNYRPGATESNNVTDANAAGVGAERFASGATGFVGPAATLGVDPTLAPPLPASAPPPTTSQTPPPKSPPPTTTPPPVETPPVTTPPVTTPPTTTPPSSSSGTPAAPPPPVTAPPPVAAPPSDPASPPSATPPSSTPTDSGSNDPSTSADGSGSTLSEAPASSTPPATSGFSDTPITMQSLADDVITDRQELTLAIQQRKTTLSQLRLQKQHDLSAYRAAERQLHAAHAVASRAPAGTTQMAADSTLQGEIQELLAAVQADQLALKIDQHSDFTNILPARQTLAGALHAVSAARRSSR